MVFAEVFGTQVNEPVSKERINREEVRFLRGSIRVSLLLEAETLLANRNAQVDRRTPYFARHKLRHAESRKTRARGIVTA